MPKPASSREYSVAMTVTPEFELESFDCLLPEKDFDIRVHILAYTKRLSGVLLKWDPVS